MVSTPPLQEQLQEKVQARTGRKIRNLAIEMCPERIILHGLTSTYYAKQLAQQGVREMLPHVHLENAIVVAQ